MTVVGHGGTDIIRQLVVNVINIFKKKRPPCSSACDGFIIRMHYQWTFWFLLAGFSMVWYSWYHRDVITCVSHFNAENQVRLDYINICLSYPYLLDPETGERRYLLFYRWIHWTLLLMSAVYYIPRKVSKVFENLRIKKLVEDLSVHSYRYDNSEREIIDRAVKFIAYNLNTHNGLYFKYLFCNVLCLVIDIFAFRFLDFVFQGRFLHYGWKAYPYTRNPNDFTDYMSRTFPPFVKCELGPSQRLVSRRTEEFGCHMTIMELYEKYFLVLWLWLIIVTFLTCCYLIFLGFMWLSYFRMMLLKVEKPLNQKDASVSDTIMKVLDLCKIGDVYLMYRLRQHLSHARFFDVLTRLSEPDSMKLISDDPSDRIIESNKMQDINNMRNRKNVGMIGSKSKHPNDFYINSSLLIE